MSVCDAYVLRDASSAFKGGLPRFLCVTSTHVAYSTLSNRVFSLLSPPQSTWIPIQGMRLDDFTNIDDKTYFFSRQNTPSTRPGRVTAQMLLLAVHTRGSHMGLGASRRFLLQ